MKILSAFFYGTPEQPECEKGLVEESEPPTRCKKRQRGKEAEETMNLVEDSALPRHGRQNGTTRGECIEIPGEEHSCVMSKKNGKSASEPEITNVAKKIEHRCAEFIDDIERVMPLLDQHEAEACRAVLLEISNCTKVLPRVLQGADFKSKESVIRVHRGEQEARERAKWELQQAQCKLEETTTSLKKMREAYSRVDEARERAEEELQQARCECAKAVEDLNKTRAELAAAFPGGGDIAGTFPIASELRSKYLELCSQDLFDLAPDDLPGMVALFKPIFTETFNECSDRFHSCCSEIKWNLYLDEHDDAEWRPVEGLVQKAMRLRRSAMFNVDWWFEEWLDSAVSDEQHPFSIFLQTNPNGKPLLVKSMQSLSHLMGCFHLSQPELHVDPHDIGEEVEFAPNLHQVLDDRCKAGSRCTIIFPALMQDKKCLCKAFVIPTHS